MCHHMASLGLSEWSFGAVPFSSLHYDSMKFASMWEAVTTCYFMYIFLFLSSETFQWKCGWRDAHEQNQETVRWGPIFYLIQVMTCLIFGTNAGLLYPPPNEVVWGYIGFTLSVRLSVPHRPASRVRSVVPTLLVGSISYLHILSSNFRRCVACKVSCKILKFEFLAIFLNL